MLLVTGVVSAASLMFSLARWHRAGVHFHPLFQLQLMGLNGAFLTADLFNLFVFFEVMLVASYGLLLHGSGRERVRAGLHYIAINLLASSLFLVGVAMLYGITGTLNMADMAQKIPAIPVSDRGLLHAGASILGIAFLVKAATWPMGFWLVPAYAAASAPVAALFVILTKVGVYAVLRLWTLLLSAEAGSSALFGVDALVWGGLVTLAFASLGVMASQRLRRLAGYSIVASAGTLIAAIGFGQPALVGAALFYLLGSTLAGCALFLIVELIERSREVEVAAPLAGDETDHLPFFIEAAEPDDGANLDDEQQALTGRVIPAAMAFLGLSFVLCALVIAGLPPMSGFLAKFAMLDVILNPAGMGQPAAPPLVSVAGWTLFALLIVSGLLSMIALSRAGMRYFWAPQGRPVPRLRVIESMPIALLLLVGAALSVRAGPVLDYTRATGAGLLQPSGYVDAVMSARPVPSPPRVQP
jgi:multicomponent K+:H+ antiporter subunit D